MKILKTPEIILGDAVLGEINNILDKLNAKRIMVVTGKIIANTEIYDNLKIILETKKVVSFNDVEADPSIRSVKKVSEIARRENIDVMIGFGGGSSLDTAKVAAALVTNEKDIENYIGIDLLENESIPLIAVPTTAGTGSEVTNIAVLSDTVEKLKKGIVSSYIIPKYAILDASLTINLPKNTTAATGMDALIHAVEAYTSVNATDYTDMIARKAIKLIKDNLLAAYNNGENITARRNMLVGSLLAGLAFTNAGVTAVHAFAYPLGGIFHVPHGLANSVMFASVMQFNIIGNEKRFDELGKLFDNEKGNGKIFIEAIDELILDLNIPRNLEELKIPKESISDLAEGAIKVTRLLANNPRKITLEDAKDIYTNAYSK